MSTVTLYEGLEDTNVCIMVSNMAIDTWDCKSSGFNCVDSTLLQSILTKARWVCHCSDELLSAHPRGLHFFLTSAVTSGRDRGYRVVASQLGNQPAVRLHLYQSLVLQLVTVGCSTQGAMVFITSSKERGSLDWRGEEKPFSIMENTMCSYLPGASHGHTGR